MYNPPQRCTKTPILNDSPKDGDQMFILLPLSSFFEAKINKAMKMDDEWNFLQNKIVQNFTEFPRATFIRINTSNCFLT